MQAAEPALAVSRPVTPEPALARNVAVDAYRGFVMLLMMAEVLEFARVAKAYPGNWVWNALAWSQTHVAWAGCSLHDTIQPGFSFLVGVALPYSIASRIAKGGTFGKMFAHALWRSLLLIALGIFLRSLHHNQTYFTFEDTLTQIGLGYPFLFLLGFRPPRWAWIALGAVLFGYWLAWAVYPAGPVLDHYSGFAAHWNKTSNLGVRFDQWFLNLFPREKPFVANGGGYVTLSFIPTLGTMILGLIAGRWLRDRAQLRKLLIAGAIGIAAGAVLHATGICPVVKRIWTPSWTLFSGGLCFVFLAAFMRLGNRRWLFPVVVVGMNSIAAYLIAHLSSKLVFDSLKIHLGLRPFDVFGTGLEPLTMGAAALVIYWLLLFWMYRRKIFLRI